MRKIKFRAWDKKRKRMFYGDKLDEPNMLDFQGNVFITGNTGKLCDCGCSAQYINWAEVEDYEIELMQYTGLKDKNGQEIYEGDIVKYCNGNIGVIYFDEEYVAFRVKWLRHPKYLVALSEFEEMIAKNCEVIGNIYENPELLERQDKNL